MTEINFLKSEKYQTILCSVSFTSLAYTQMQGEIILSGKHELPFPVCSFFRICLALSADRPHLLRNSTSKCQNTFFPQSKVLGHKTYSCKAVGLTQESNKTGKSHIKYIKARSHNHCCSRKEISRLLHISICVCVRE